MKNPFRSLAAKLLLFTGGATVVTLLGAMIASGIDSSTRTREAVYRDAESTAGSVASTITREISALSSAVATMSTTLGSVNESGTKQRSMVLAMMKSVVSQYDLAFGVTFIEENAAWDGQTGASLMGNNQTGDFAAYWSKETGDITFTSVPTTREDPWYKVPATTRKATLTEPFVYDSGTKKIMMTTIAYPVMAAGQFIGVGSFDVNLETLSANVASMRPFGEGRVMLVSGSGAWLATPEADLLMKPYQEAGEGDLMAAIADGKARMLHDVETKNGPVERVIYPFSIPGLNTSWAAIVDVPADVIAAPIRSQLAMLVIGGMVILAVLLVALYSSTLLIVRRPVAMLLNSVDKLGRGDLDTPVIGQMRKDEIGGLSKSLDGFRLALRQGRNAELQAEAERESADRERRESEAERAAGATQQALVVDGLSEALKHLSSGNLSFELSRPFPERFEALRSDYNQAVGQLRASMNAVAHSTSSIDNGSREISKSADDLSRRTEQQAASLEETAAALDEITTNVANAAKRAEDARAVAVRANESAQLSGSVVANTVDAMGRIEKSSETISSIVGVIDEIAFQTNLLALNAGVEAARAGDAGKGFAVVAQEVRELAQRSAKAAKEIKQLIRNSNAEVEIGVKLVSDTGAVLKTIESYIIDINRHMEAIVVSAQEQSVGLTEVNKAVNQMDQFTQQNAAMVEETNAAGVTLAEEAGQLRQLVSQFHLDGSPVVNSSLPVSLPQSHHGPVTSPARSMVRKVAQAFSGRRGNTAVDQRWEES